MDKTKFEELTVEEAIKHLRALSQLLPWLLNTAADGFEGAIKQGLILPSDTVDAAKKKISEHPQYKSFGLP